jgi:hypothetical protein
MPKLSPSTTQGMRLRRVLDHLRSMPPGTTPADTLAEFRRRLVEFQLAKGKAR